MDGSQIPLSYSSMASEALTQVLQRLDGRPHDEAITEFENKLTELTSSPFAVALNSGTAAIHLALKALSVSVGDTIPVSTFTYIGSVNPIFYVGAQPVFVDSEELTWNMDPIRLEKCLSDLSSKGKLPKAIIVVHAYGMPAKMNELKSISTSYNVPVIEDAAEALGSTYRDKPVGNLGDIGVLSFNNNKSITTFGGGALLTRSKAIYDKVKYWATQAREQLPYYEHREVGYNYRMSPLNAAYGVAQLEKVTVTIEQRRSVFKRYRNLLESEGVKFLHEPDGFYSSRWLSTVAFKRGIDPLKIQLKLKEEGIESRPLWKPMHLQPIFNQLPCYGGEVSEQLFSTGLCLPSGTTLTEADINRVAEIIVKCLN